MVPLGDSALLIQNITPSDLLLKPIPMRCWFPPFPLLTLRKQIHTWIMSALWWGSDGKFQVPVGGKVPSGLQDPFGQREKMHF
jgi:hypothetical protein